MFFLVNFQPFVTHLTILPAIFSLTPEGRVHPPNPRINCSQNAVWSQAAVAHNLCASPQPDSFVHAAQFHLTLIG